MLNDDDGMAARHQCVKGGEQALDVMKMETGGRFVKDKQGGVLSLLTDEICQFHPLILTTGER